MSLHRVLPLPPALKDEGLARRWAARNDSLEDARIMSDGRHQRPSYGNPRLGTPPFQKDSSSPEERRTLSPSQESVEDYESPVSSRRARIPREAHDAADRTQGLSEESPSSICLCQPDPKIPRPRNAFILFRQHHQASVVSKNPGLANPQISKIIGEHWKNAPEEVKVHWKRLAEEEKVRHHKQYPNYRYQPRKGNRASSVSSSFPSADAGDSSPARCPKCGGHSINSSNMMSITGNSHQLGHRPSQSSHPSSRPLTAATSISGGPRYVRTVLSPPGHPVPTPGYRYPPQRSIAVPSPQSKRPEQFEMPPYSPDPKRRRVAANMPLMPVRAPPGPQSPIPFPPHHQRRQSLPRLDSLGLNRPSPVTASPNLKQQNHSDRPEKSLTLAPLRSAHIANTKEHEKDTQAKSLEAMILSIPILNKIKVLARISAPFSPSSLSSAALHGLSEPMGKRGLVIAVDAADQTALKQLTRRLANSLSEHEVRVIQTPQLPQDVKPSFQSYLRLIYEYHTLSEHIKSEIVNRMTGRQRPGEKDGRSQDGDRDDEMVDAAEEERGEDEEDDDDEDSLVSPKSFPKPLPQRKTESTPTAPGRYPPAPSSPRPSSSTTYSKSPSSPFSNLKIRSDAGTSVSKNQGLQNSSPFPPNAPSSSPFSPPPASSSASGRAERGRPPPSSPSASSSSSVAPSRTPIFLLPAWQLTHTDAFACSVDIADRYSPVDHWQWGATVWRGVIGADITVAVRTARNGSGGGAGAGGGTGSEDSPPTSGGDGSVGPGPSKMSISTGSGVTLQQQQQQSQLQHHQQQHQQQHQQHLHSTGAIRTGSTSLGHAATPGLGGGVGDLAGGTPASAAGPSGGNGSGGGGGNGLPPSSATASLASTSASTGSSSVGVEIRLDDAGAVIVRGEADGSIAEAALRRVGFEVGEWVRGWLERFE